MNRKPTFAENLKKFVEGKGFYVAVLVCVAAIGISGFYLLHSLSAQPPAEAPVSVSAAVTVTPPPAPTASAAPRPSASAGAGHKPTATPAPAVTPPSVTVPSPSPSQPAPSASQTPAPSAVPTRPTTLVYTWPVKGAVLADFSLETLAYDETMGDWRTHSGVDIAASPGTTVLAAADGTVQTVYADDLMGTTVVIDHGNGMLSTYANLQTVPTVSEGDEVHTGSVIGAVGTTAIAESGRPGHLHFELCEDGIAVDPELYLPEEH